MAALGALGVVTEVTLAVEPTYWVRQDVYDRLSWSALTESFAAVMGAGYSVSAVTDFAADSVEMLWVKSRTDTVAEMPADAVRRAGRDRAAPPDPRQRPVRLYAAAGRAGTLVRPAAALPARVHAQQRSGDPERVLWTGRTPRRRSRRCGLSVRASPPPIRSAEIRTVAADGLWLSPAYERDVFGVHFTWHPDGPRVSRLVDEIESVLAPFAPRPHWAKVFGPDPDWTALYPRLADFRRLAERYDPDGVFANDFLRRSVLA